MFEFAKGFVKDVECMLEKELSTTQVEVFDMQATDLLQEGYSYATKDGGKRIRPICVYLGALATGRAIGEKYDGLVRLATMVEMIHSYSLVHDDLPAMDDDDYRRGKLSTHKKFGEANGILIGDGLLTKAMEIALSKPQDTLFTKSAHILSKGALNMVTGQALDLADGDKDYMAVYALKTAQLIATSFEAGATYMGAEEDDVKAIGEYGHHIGMAFQIADDLLDDSDNSVVKAVGREQAQNVLIEETMSAQECAKKMSNSDMLTEFAQTLLKRKK